MVYISLNCSLYCSTLAAKVAAAASPNVFAVVLPGGGMRLLYGFLLLPTASPNVAAAALYGGRSISFNSIAAAIMACASMGLLSFARLLIFAVTESAFLGSQIYESRAAAAFGLPLPRFVLVGVAWLVLLVGSSLPGMGAPGSFIAPGVPLMVFAWCS